MIIHNLWMRTRFIQHKAHVVYAVQVIVEVYHRRINTVHSLNFLMIVRCFLRLQAINLDYFNNFTGNKNRAMRLAL